MGACPKIMIAAALAKCCYCAASRTVDTIPAPGYVPHTNMNCFEGHGATEVIDVYVHLHTGDTDRDDRGAIATYKCKRRCDRRESCTAFTTQHTPMGILNCFLRTDIVIANCEQNARRFTTYTRALASASESLPQIREGRRLRSTSAHELSHNRSN